MNLTSFFVYCLIVTITPGPTNITILSSTHNYGTQKAMKYVYGATLAFGMLLCISVFLNTLLSSFLPQILEVMKIIGCGYMLYLAIQLYKMDASESSGRQSTTFVSGFLMQFVNPKVILFTMTIIPGFVMPYYSETPVLFLFVLAITIIGLGSFVAWVLFGRAFKTLMQRYQKPVNVIMALFLVYSAILVSGVIELIGEL